MRTTVALLLVLMLCMSISATAENAENDWDAYGHAEDQMAL